MAEPPKIFLFTSKSSRYFQSSIDEFAKLLQGLEVEREKLTSEIIDISERPDLAHLYKVETVPMIIIGDERFIGEPNADEILKIIKSKRRL